MLPFSTPGAGGHRPRFVAVASLTLLTGCMGAHLQAGPTVGYSFKRGTTVGWEAGAGSVGIVRLSTGGTYRLEPLREPEGARPGPAPSGDSPDAAARPDSAARTTADEEDGPSPANAIHYLALEPLGVSLGVTFPDVGKPGFLGGVWAGWFFDPNPHGAIGYTEDPNPLTPHVDCPNSQPEPGFLLSGAVGLRYMGGEWEAYFAPKAVILWCVEYAS